MYTHAFTRKSRLASEYTLSHTYKQRIVPDRHIWVNIHPTPTPHRYWLATERQTLDNIHSPLTSAGLFLREKDRILYLVRSITNP